MFYDARHRTELIEKDRVRERRCWTAPPAIDDLNDVIVVLLTERARDHGLLSHLANCFES